MNIILFQKFLNGYLMIWAAYLKFLEMNSSDGHYYFKHLVWIN